jgi:hypothetical protein
MDNTLDVEAKMEHLPPRHLAAFGAACAELVLPSSLTVTSVSSVRSTLERSILSLWRLVIEDRLTSDLTVTSTELRAMLETGDHDSPKQSLIDAVIAASIYTLQAYELHSAAHAVYASEVAIDTADAIEGWSASSFPTGGTRPPLVQEEIARQARALNLLTRVPALGEEHVMALRTEAHQLGTALSRRLQEQIGKQSDR